MDTHSAFTELILSVSLGVHTVMEFSNARKDRGRAEDRGRDTCEEEGEGKDKGRAVDKDKNRDSGVCKEKDRNAEQKQGETEKGVRIERHTSIVLPRRSMLVMRGESR